MLSGLGSVYRACGDYQKAIDYHLQQLHLVRKLGERVHEATSLLNLSSSYFSLWEL